MAQAARLLATVLGQDLEQDGDGVFRIARKVARGPGHLHGRSRGPARAQDRPNRSFDGYKGHVAEDPDSEIITATAVTAGNVGDAEPAAELLADVLHTPAPNERAEDERAEDERAADERAEVYGDAAYGTGPLLAELAEAGV